MGKGRGHPAREPLYGVVWPLGKIATKKVTPSSPVADLNGKRVGEVWDWLFKGDVMFSIIREKLQERFPEMGFASYTEFGSTLGVNDRGVIAALPEKLRQHGCDAVISAVGA